MRKLHEGLFAALEHKQCPVSISISLPRCCHCCLPGPPHTADTLGQEHRATATRILGGKHFNTRLKHTDGICFDHGLDVHINPCLLVRFLCPMSSYSNKVKEFPKTNDKRNVAMHTTVSWWLVPTWTWKSVTLSSSICTRTPTSFPAFLGVPGGLLAWPPGPGSAEPSRDSVPRAILRHSPELVTAATPTAGHAPSQDRGSLHYSAASESLKREKC